MSHEWWVILASAGAIIVLLIMRRGRRRHDTQQFTQEFEDTVIDSYLEDIVVVSAEDEYEEEIAFTRPLAAAGQRDEEIAALCAEMDYDSKQFMTRFENELIKWKAEFMLKVHTG